MAELVFVTRVVLDSFMNEEVGTAVVTGTLAIGPFHSTQYSLLGTSLEQSTPGFIAWNVDSSRAQSRDIVAQVSPSVAGQVIVHSLLCSRCPSANAEAIVRRVNANEQYGMLIMMRKKIGNSVML